MILYFPLHYLLTVLLTLSLWIVPISPANNAVFIQTIAGTGVFGYSGDFVAATTTEVMGYSVMGDTMGNIYIADVNRIRKVNWGSNFITTVAGGGALTTEGIPATSAAINTARRVWITTSGVLYFVDKGTRRIRRVISGIITTVVGSGNTGYSGENTTSLGTSMTNPFSMYVDSNGNIFYTDYGQHRARQYSPFTNTVWTIAGTGSVGFSGDGDFATLARLNSPAGIFGDTNGNIYIADQGNYRIRKVTANNGYINTIAGSGGVSCTAADRINALIISICQPAGLFLDTQGNLYYSDLNTRIRLIYSTSNIVVNIAGNGNNGYVQDGVLANMTKINSASEIWADSNSVLYIGDFGNHRVRRVNLDKTITTFAGNGLYSSYGDGGPASLAQLNSPKGIFLSTAGVLYIADTSNCKVRAVMISSSNIIGTYGGTGACGGDPSTKPVSLLNMNLPIAIWGDKYGNFYVTENNWIRKVDASNQATVWIGTGGCCYNGENKTGTSVVLGSPQGIWGTTDGASLFVAEGLGHRIRKVDVVARTAITYAGTGSVGAPTENVAATLSDMNTPYSVWVDSIGVVYFAEFTNNVIRKVVYNAVLGISEVRTIAGNQLATYNGDHLAATMTAVNRPTFVTGDSSGRIYFVDSNNKLVRVIQAVNSSFTEVATVVGKYAGNTATGLQLATDSGLNTPLSAVVDTNGDIYVVEGPAGFVKKTMTVSSPTGQPSSRPTFSPTNQPSSQPTAKPWLKPTSQPTCQPTSQPSRQPTRQPTSQPTCQPTSQPSRQPTRQPTSRPSIQPTAQPSGQPSSQPFSRPTTTPSRQPSSQPTMRPSNGPSSQPSAQPSTHPTSQPTKRPTGVPSPCPTSQPSSLPTSQPSVLPSSNPSREPRSLPTSTPSVLPTALPSSSPSEKPTAVPSCLPTSFPSLFPSSVPSNVPSSLPSNQPWSLPTSYPSGSPSSRPTHQPSAFPSGVPSSLPSSQPSIAPSNYPTILPSGFPTSHPTGIPSRQPLPCPTSEPTSTPSNQPTSFPSLVPSVYPTSLPSEGSVVPPSCHPGIHSISSLPTILFSSSPPVSQEPSSAPSSVLLCPSIGNYQPSSVPSNGSPYALSLIPTVPPSASSLSPSVFPSSGTTTPVPTSLPSGSSSTSKSPTTFPSRGNPMTLPTLNTSSTVLPTVIPTSVPFISSPTIDIVPSIVPTVIPLSPIPTKPTDIPTVSPSYPPLTKAPTSQPSGQPSSRPSYEIVPLKTRGRYPFSLNISARFLSTCFYFTPQTKRKDVFGRVPLNTSLPAVNYIFYGQRNLSPVINLPEAVQNSRASEIITIQGDYLFNDPTLRSIAIAGDVNHDNHQDLILGDPLSSRAYLLFGNELGFANITKGVAIVSTKSEASSSSDGLGWSVAGIGHFNADSFDDFIVCGLLAQSCAILFGKKTNFTDFILDNLTRSDGLLIRRSITPITGATLGAAVSCAGDFNGDGFNDVLITSFQSNQQKSSIFLLFGGNYIASRGVVYLESLSSLNMLRITAPSLLFAGVSLTKIGDVNGDGLDDIAIGSVPYQGGFNGQVTYLIYGKTSSLLVNPLDLQRLSPSDGIVLRGGGFQVAGLGDLNGDGLADLLITSYGGWSGQQGSYLLILPESLTSFPTNRPSLFPSGQPSCTPSSLPSSMPSLAPSHPTFQPTASPQGPTLVPSFRPISLSITPSIRPSMSSPRPSLSPSVQPSREPSIISTPAPSFWKTMNPSNTRPPSSLCPSQTKRPSRIPSVSSQPSTPAPSLPFNYSRIQLSDEGEYVASRDQDTIFLVNCPQQNCRVEISPDISSSSSSSVKPGRHVYAIYPSKGLMLVLNDFSTSLDLIDLRAFSSVPGAPTNLSELSFSTNPLTLHLPMHILVQLTTHVTMDLAAADFLFPSSSPSASSELSWSALVGRDIVIMAVVLGFACVFSFAVHSMTNGERQEQEAFEKKFFAEPSAFASASSPSPPLPSNLPSPSVQPSALVSPAAANQNMINQNIHPETLKSSSIEPSKGSSHSHSTRSLPHSRAKKTKSDRIPRVPSVPTTQHQQTAVTRKVIDSKIAGSSISSSSSDSSSSSSEDSSDFGSPEMNSFGSQDLSLDFDYV